MRLYLVEPLLNLNNMDTFNKNLSKLLETAHVSPPLTGSSRINMGITERIISVAGGTALTIYGLKKKGIFHKALAAVGSSLILRGAAGHCPVNEMVGRDSAEVDGISIEITRSLTINKPRELLYAYWRDLENLPNFMKHLDNVVQTGGKESNWSARIPGDLGTIDWTAEVTEEIGNERIAWKSLPGSDIDNAGEVRFKDAPADRGTVVQSNISYRAPAGIIGGKAAKLLNPVFKQMVKEDLRRFKRLMENGEIPTIENQPSGRA